MKKFHFNPSKAKALEFDLSMFDDCVESPFVVLSSYVRIDDGTKDKGYRKPGKDEKVDLNKAMNHVYLTIGIEGQTNNLGSDLAVLNNCEGWADVIEVSGNQFSIKDGARITKAGKTLTFSLN